MNAFLQKAAASLLGGVVGLNFRNRHFVSRHNHRREIGIARDKVATKERLEPKGISVARTLGVIRRSRDIERIYAQLVEMQCGFVVKPARSAQGRGIILCRRATPEGVEKLSGAFIEKRVLLFHLHQIIHGEYSFGRPDDSALVEELLVTDSNWIMRDLPGSPDLRIILFKNKVVMAMARLPTTLSEGRANLHCGAVGVGVDIETGATAGGVQGNKIIDAHPDNGLPLAGNKVEDFDKCLQSAYACAHAFKLGYIGIDLMRDREKGPVVLEVNSRPGLALQIANRKGLLTQLDFS